MNSSHKKSRVLCCGTFDYLHPGHESFLHQASILAEELYVVVARDSNVLRLKGRLPDHDEKTRKTRVENLGIAQKVVLGYEGFNLLRIVAELNPEAALAVAGAMAEANPMAAEGTAGAIADALPDIAADAAGAMAAANPDVAGEVAAGMAGANPEIAGDVAGAMMDAAPDAAAAMAGAVAEAAQQSARNAAAEVRERIGNYCTERAGVPAVGTGPRRVGVPYGADWVGTHAQQNVWKTAVCSG